MQGVDLVGLLHIEIVYPPEDGQLSCIPSYSKPWQLFHGKSVYEYSDANNVKKQFAGESTDNGNGQLLRYSVPSISGSDVLVIFIRREW